MAGIVGPSEQSTLPTRGFLLVAAGLLLIAACASTDRLTVSDIEGYWVLESFEVAGIETRVEMGVNAVRTPWIEIGSSLVGNGGCNGFRSAPNDAFTFSDGVLRPDDVVRQAALCTNPDGPDVMAAEEALFRVLWVQPPEIRVERTGDEMVWTAGDTRLMFVATDGPPDE